MKRLLDSFSIESCAIFSCYDIQNDSTQVLLILQYVQLAASCSIGVRYVSNLTFFPKTLYMRPPSRSRDTRSVEWVHCTLLARVKLLTQHKTLRVAESWRLVYDDALLLRYQVQRSIFAATIATDWWGETNYAGHGTQKLVHYDKPILFDNPGRITSSQISNVVPLLKLPS